MLSCGDGSTPTVLAPPGAIATHRFGGYDLAALEIHLGRTQERRALGRAEVVERYRRAAEALTVEEHIFRQIGDPVAALKASGEFQRLHREAVLAWDFENTGEDPISRERSRAFYSEHRDRFEEPEQRHVWHIYRRHSDPNRPEETAAFLGKLKHRALGGEAFADLARQHSHSETRVRGGDLGWLPRGRMARRLDAVVFSLGAGELSDPVPAPGGVTLFFVSDTRAERTYSYEDVRSRIESWLRTAQRAERLDDRVAGLDPPAGSIVLDHDDLLAKFEAHNSEATVLSIGDFSVTLVELGRLLEDTKTATPPWGSRADRISSLYRQLVRHQLLYLELCSTARSTIGVGSTSTGLPSLRSTRGFK